MTRGSTRLAGKNLLFAELIVVILFFSIAAAGCVLLFAEAHRDSQHSSDLTNAVIMAQNTAEIFKATGEVSYTEANGLRTSSVLTENGNVSELYIYVQKEEVIIYEITALRIRDIIREVVS